MRFEETLMQTLPTLYRRAEKNVIRSFHRALYQVCDAVADAIAEYVNTSYPLDTASSWVLDEHWGPKFNVPRNGLNDDEYRLYIKAQILVILSAGQPNKILRILRLLIPEAASIDFTQTGTKAWKVAVIGIDLAGIALAFKFLSTAPSPAGGGFATAGENGLAVAWDPEVLSFSSVHGAVPIDGFFSSVHGASGAIEAGYAHASQL